MLITGIPTQIPISDVMIGWIRNEFPTFPFLQPFENFPSGSNMIYTPTTMCLRDVVFW